MVSNSKWWHCETQKEPKKNQSGREKMITYANEAAGQRMREGENVASALPGVCRSTEWKAVGNVWLNGNWGMACGRISVADWLQGP